ncbi:MAG: HAMP domain-containing histidine kinase, partial [Actinotalea sp.]|nr:HAMP domain-containing histidine kinase [Actinotalea sp.]
MHAVVSVPLGALVAAATLLAGLVALVAWWATRALRSLRDSRHEAERLRDLAKERAQRTSVLSHEIRTPLALVKGAGELLAEETPGPLNDRQRQFLATITQNVQQVIDMAEDLLVEARMEATLFDVHLTTTDLRVLVRQTVRELRRLHSVPILLDSRGAPLMVPVDRNLMRQAIWNLVNNAARHAGEGVSITVRLVGGDETVLLSVSDDGSGMTPQERAALFTPFATGSTRRPGAGLGMMITQRIVELHGGRMFV